MTAAISRWADLAAAAAPELGLTAVELVETGWDSRVLHATAADGARWILRFPRRPEVVADMVRERRVLALLHDQELPIAVPEWQIHSLVPAGDGEQLVVGYRELPGAPAAVEPRGDGVFDFAIEIPPPPRYAATLGAALAALHAVDPGLLTHVSAADLRAEAAATSAMAQELPVPPSLLEHWQRWIDDDRWWEFTTVLRHGDVHPGHTMVDADSAVVGIIDWTDAGLGDPATDFIDPRHAFGDEFGDELLAAYAAAGGRVGTGQVRTGQVGAISGRVVHWQSFASAPAALFGRDQGRPDLLAAAIGRMRAQATRLEAGGPPV